MTALAFLFLIASPGAAVVFGLPDGGLRWSTRFWIGAALSPFVAAVVLLVLEALGFDHATAANLVLVPCFAGLLLAVRAAPRAPAVRETLPGAACAAIVLAAMGAVLWICWLDRPVTQYTAWHALHHTDISYATTKVGALPRDPSLAGSLIRYPFFAHGFWGWLGVLLDRPPNVVYRWTNIAWLFVTGALVYEFARSLRVRPVFSALAVLLVLSGNNLVASVADVLTGGFAASARLGDVRYSLFLQKFYSFNVVPFGLGLAAAMMTLCVQMLTRSYRRSLAPLFAVVLTGAGTIYPLLLPALWVGAAGVVGILTTPLLRAPAGVRGREAAELVTGLAVATALSLGYLAFCLSGRAAPAASWEWGQVFLKARYAALSLGPMLLLALPGFVRGLRARDPGIVFCLLLFLVSVAFYLLVPVASGNEYKTVFLATMIAAVVAASSLDRLLPRSRVGVVVAILVLLAPLAWLNYVRLGLLSQPRLRVERLALVVDSFSLELAPRDRRAEWTAAIRAGTSERTVVLAPRQSFPASVVTRRDLYVPRSVYWVGYEVQPRTMVIDVRGADPEVYDRRVRVHRAIYGVDSNRYAAAWSELSKLGRPVAIRFDTKDHPFLGWLAQRGLGERLPTKNGSLVYVERAP